MDVTICKVFSFVSGFFFLVIAIGIGIAVVTGAGVPSSPFGESYVNGLTVLAGGFGFSGIVLFGIGIWG